MAVLVVRQKLLGIHELKKALYDLGYLRSILGQDDTSPHEGSSVISGAVKNDPGLVNSFEASHQSLPFFLTERHSTEEPSCKLK